MRQTAGALAQLLISWWSKDRIRVARDEGKLFRIVAGDRLIVRERLMMVLECRQVVRDGDAQIRFSLLEVGSSDDELWYLTYTIRCTEQKQCEEETHTSGSRKEELTLKTGAQTMELCPDEVCVLKNG